MGNNSIKENILADIKSGKEKMRSKYIFYLISVFWIISSVILLVSLMFLISFLIFSGQKSELNLLWQFGISGFINLILSLPWLIISGCILVFLLLHQLLRDKSILYKRPIIYTLLILLFFIIGSGTIMAKTSMHENIINLAQEKNFPEVSKIYQKYIYRKARGIYVGRISQVGEGEIVVRDNKGHKTTVNLNKESKNELKNNDTVIIFGKNQRGKVRAIKIKQIGNKLDKNERK
ncbi:MAG: hypothetical protein PHV47_00455 [Candidatus Pacebacteria bacterium]|nr:hypothetical protein [Candidatus Paceibacterota bacterium]